MLYTRKERNGYWVETGLRCLTLSVQICGLGFIVYGGTLAAGQNVTGDVVFPILIVYNAIHVLRLQAILRPGKNQQPPSPPSRGLISCLIFLELIVTGVAVMGSIFIIFTHDPKYVCPPNFSCMIDPDDRSGEWEFPGWAMMWTSAGLHFVLIILASVQCCLKPRKNRAAPNVATTAEVENDLEQKA